MSSVSSTNSLLGSASSSASPSVDISSILASAAGVSTPGIDVTAAVNSAIAAARARETAWQNQQTTYTSQTTTLNSIQTATQAIANDLQAMNSLNGPLSTRAVNSSASSFVTATAANGAAAGTHSVVVNNVATTGAWYTDLASSPTASLPATSFTLTMANGQSANFTTGSGVNTLNDLAGAINSATGSNGQALGVKATVVSDSSGSRLAIISTSSGSSSDFSVSSSNYTGTSWRSAPLPSGSSLGANTVALTVNGTTTNIQTTAGETYSQLADAINGANLGITASVSSNSQGNTLQLTSADGNTAFTISEPSFGFTQAVQGQDASLSVDGVPIDSASNTVTGAIPGVTLSLLGASGGVPVNLTVASNATQVANAINQFVSDYNSAIGLVNAQFKFSGATNSQGVLGSDSTVRQLQSGLLQALSYSMPASNGSSSISTLASMGINMNSDGTLSVDTATLASAVSTNAADVQNFFEGPALNGFAAAMNNALNTFLDPSEGAFTVDLNSIAQNLRNVTGNIDDFETNYITPLQARLTAQYSQAEIALQQLPAQMAKINAMLGFNNNGNNG